MIARFTDSTVIMQELIKSTPAIPEMASCCLDSHQDTLPSTLCSLHPRHYHSRIPLPKMEYPKCSTQDCSKTILLRDAYCIYCKNSFCYDHIENSTSHPCFPTPPEQVYITAETQVYYHDIVVCLTY